MKKLGFLPRDNKKGPAFHFLLVSRTLIFSVSKPKSDQDRNLFIIR